MTLPPGNNRKAPQASVRIAEACLAVRVRMLGRAVTSVYDEALRPFGVTTGQVNILVTVSILSGEGRRPPTQGTVGGLLYMEKSTLSRNVERLQRDGLVTSFAGDDARSRCLTVTPKGDRMIERILPAWERAQERAGALLGRDAERALSASAEQLWKETTPAG